jgi:coenzyme F420-reducing hydrogenase beta subunit
MIYGVCTHCSHTQDLAIVPDDDVWIWGQHCFSCGCYRYFRVVRQVEQPDGSVIEVTS